MYLKYDIHTKNIEFKWFSSPPSRPDWYNLKDLRFTFGNSEVDGFIGSFLTGIPDPSDVEVTGWRKFKGSIVALHGILAYEKATVDYLKNALKEITNDQIQHVQIRTSLLPLCRDMYDSTGKFFYSGTLFNLRSPNLSLPIIIINYSHH